VTAVLGVDGCPGGWVGVFLSGSASWARTAPTLAELVAEPVDCVAIDIPIALPDSGRRACDQLVRRVLSPRSSTVFDAAVRGAYEAPSHVEGSAVHRALTGRGLSIQAWYLGPRVLDANAFARAGTVPVVEAHPELCFAWMGDGPLPTRKRTPAGAAQRRALLGAHGIAVPEGPRPAKPDDLLDACAAAWTARRWVLGDARSYPEVPEVFSDGLPAAIQV